MQSRCVAETALDSLHVYGRMEILDWPWPSLGHIHISVYMVMSSHIVEILGKLVKIGHIGRYTQQFSVIILVSYYILV